MGTLTSSRTIVTGSARVRINQVHYAPGEWQPRHCHSQASVTLIYCGSLEETAGRRSETAGALSVVVKPAGIEHEDRFGPDGATTLQFCFDAEHLNDDSGEHGMDEWRWIHGGTASECFLGLLRALRRDEDESTLECSIYEVLGALGPALTGRHDRPPRWLSRIADEIDDTFPRPARVSDLARRSRVHPVSLARAFRRHYGSSITQRVKGRRVREAASLLASSGRSPADIALDCGFSDQSHLCRVFRDTTGVTPLEYRRLA